MIEKKTTENANEVRSERFEFVLTVNGYIVCQRYFRIGGFKERSLSSVQLTEAVEHCVDMINKDLAEKSNIYNWYMAPQVFQNREEMNAWVEKSHKGETFKLPNPQFVILRDSEEVFNWDGVNMLPYDKPFDRADYVGESATPCILKFAFLDNKKEIRSFTWDIAKICPRFVRNNIDLSNSKNKYKGEGVFAPIEEFIVDKYITSMSSIIPKILGTLSSACSLDNASEYTTYIEYGGRKYDLDIAGAEAKYIKQVEAEYRTRTAEYFRS